jgi:multidrug efflux pump subunit AcrA (membrane-fusion protein)
MRFLGRSLVALVLLAATLGLLVAAAVTVRASLEARAERDNAPRTARERVFAATVTAVQPQDVTPTLETFGEVRTRRTLDLRAPRAGRVIWLAEGFEDGAEVSEGQVLIRLDPSDARAARDLALADRTRADADARDAARTLELVRDELAAAQAQLDLRRQALERQRSLRDRGVGSEAALEAAELAASQAAQSVLSRRQALAQAEARVEQAAVAQARLAITLSEADRALQETEITAGFTGRLSGITLSEGGLVSVNERLGQIIDPNALEISARLSVSQYARLADASGALRPVSVEAALDVLGTEIIARGTLVRSSAAVGEGQAGRVVYATLEAAPGFRPGDFVTLRLPEPVLENVVLLPATALGADGTVLAIGAEDRLEAIPATLLRRQGDQVILSAAGLSGREIVTERNALLGAGIKVRPLRAEGAAIPAEDSPEMIELSPERRAQLVAFVEGNSRMPKDAKTRLLEQLSQDQVPAQVIARIEARMGG